MGSAPHPACRYPPGGCGLHINQLAANIFIFFPLFILSCNPNRDCLFVFKLPRGNRENPASIRAFLIPFSREGNGFAVGKVRRQNGELFGRNNSFRGGFLD